MMEADPIHQLATGGLVYGEDPTDIRALIALPGEAPSFINHRALI